jgi:hypothetical protein
LLPSKPLAVGESEELQGLDRLGVEGMPLGELTSNPEEKVVFDEPASITLRKVDSTDEVRLAYLTLGFKAHVQKAGVEGGKPVVGTLRYDGAVLYDLDRRHITQADLKLRVEGPGELEGRPVVASFAFTQVIRFEKQAPRP